MREFLVTLLLSILVISTCFAQDETTPVDNIFRGTRLVNEQSANVVERGKLNLLIQHRFGEIDGGFYDLFGLDQAAMRLGFEYGFGEDFTAGFGRSSFLKTYDVFGKYRITQQSNRFPLTIAVTAAGSLPTLRNYFPADKNNFSDKVSGNVQLHLAKAMGNFGFQVSPGYLSTGYLLTESKNLMLLISSFSASISLSRRITANLEYLAFFNSDFSTNNPLSLGIDVNTSGHIFQLILSNSQRMVTQGLYTNTLGDWTEGNLYFGFNLIREFRIKYY